MRIISWNVNGVRAIAKKGFGDLYCKIQPEICCLQETKVHPEQIDPDFLNGLNCRSYWSASERPGYSGTGTLLKTPVKSVTYGIGIKKFDTEGRMVITDHDDFLLYNVYFPNGGASELRHNFKQEFLRAFYRHLAKMIRVGRSIIVLGDYNIACQDIDVYDPKGLANQSGFLPEERAWFEQFLELGFIDCFREFHPGARDRFTWWDYRQRAKQGNRGWRIDYICVTQGLRTRLSRCEQLDDVSGSDHCPVLLELV